MRTLPYLLSYLPIYLVFWYIYLLACLSHSLRLYCISHRNLSHSPSSQFHLVVPRLTIYTLIALVNEVFHETLRNSMKSRHQF